MIPQERHGPGVSRNRRIVVSVRTGPPRTCVVALTRSSPPPGISIAGRPRRMLHGVIRDPRGRLATYCTPGNCARVPRVGPIGRNKWRLICDPSDLIWPSWPASFSRAARALPSHKPVAPEVPAEQAVLEPGEPELALDQVRAPRVAASVPPRLRRRVLQGKRHPRRRPIPRACLLGRAAAPDRRSAAPPRPQGPAAPPPLLAGTPPERRPFERPRKISSRRTRWRFPTPAASFPAADGSYCG